MSELVKTNGYTLENLKETADLFFKSGMFKDCSSMSQAFVKILAGKEWGIDPFSAMQGINIIQGKPVMAGGLISSLIKKNGKYNYNVLEHSTTKASIEFLENSKSCGVANFTMDEAAKVGLASKDNWKKYPEAMLFNRALTKGARLFCPDIFGGVIYVPEEMETVSEKVVQGTATIEETNKMTDGEQMAMVKSIEESKTQDELKEKYLSFMKIVKGMKDKESEVMLVATKDRIKAKLSEVVNE